MSEECVVALYDSLADARSGVEALRQSGVPDSQISLVTRTLKPEGEVREALEFGDDAERDAAIGAGAGALLALIAETAVFAATGMGAFLVLGPLVAGAMVGGLIGSAAGWGVHHDHIPEYEEKLHAGKVLVLAHGDPVIVAEAENVLDETRPAELHLHAESSADATDIGG